MLSAKARWRSARRAGLYRYPRAKPIERRFRRRDRRYDAKPCAARCLLSISVTFSRSGSCNCATDTLPRNQRAAQVCSRIVISSRHLNVGVPFPATVKLDPRIQVRVAEGFAQAARSRSRRPGRRQYMDFRP